MTPAVQETHRRAGSTSPAGCGAVLSGVPRAGTGLDITTQSGPATVPGRAEVRGKPSPPAWWPETRLTRLPAVVARIESHELFSAGNRATPQLGVPEFQAVPKWGKASPPDSRKRGSHGFPPWSTRIQWTAVSAGNRAHHKDVRIPEFAVPD